MAVEPLPACGARIEHYDPQRDGAKLPELLSEHGLLVIPGQHNLTADEHLSFTSLFGVAVPHPSMGKPPDLPCLVPGDCRVTVASNEEDGAFASEAFRADHWHTDVAFSVTPPSFTTLWAREVPGGGLGDTEWSCLQRSLALLSPTMQRLLGSLRGCHEYQSKRMNYTADGGYSWTRDAAKRASQPLVRRLPESNRSTLYFSPVWLTHLSGLTEAESAPMRDFLFAHAISSRRSVYRHQWAAGDLVVWDGRQTVHYGHTDFDRAHRRRLHRTTAAYEAALPAEVEGVDEPCWQESA